jgi:FG-GAP repeat protein
LDDLVIGNPNANGGTGEIVIVFAANDFITGVGGVDLGTGAGELFSLRDDDSAPRAVRIVGRETGDLFGFNVSVVGDFNGDGANDLLVGAPGASPFFDSDDDGTLDAAGIDVINLNNLDSEFGDGVADIIPGGVNNLLTDAGQAYLIFGSTASSNDLVDLAGTNNAAINVSTLGSSAFRGVVFVGREAGDMMGGGIEVKNGKRGFGVGPAGDVDGDGQGDILLGSILADPEGRTDAGEAYLIYGFNP